MKALEVVKSLAISLRINSSVCVHLVIIQIWCEQDTNCSDLWTYCFEEKKKQLSFERLASLNVWAFELNKAFWDASMKLRVVFLCLCTQGSWVCEGEALWQLAEGRSRLGGFSKPLLGDAHPAVGQRRLRRGQWRVISILRTFCTFFVFHILMYLL